jgi:N6-adenosine-specific RNA methylase IME4
MTHQNEARRVDDAAGTPELVAAVERGKLAVSVAAQAAKQTAERQREVAACAEAGNPNSARGLIKQAAALDRTKNVELDAEALGKFAVLYADPPWRYENPPIGSPARRTENHYPTMELEDICALPVADIAHEDSVLFLWSTMPKLHECMQVIDAWGFNYRTGMVWTKDKIGMGYWVRNQHELLLICRRGDIPPPPEAARCSSWVSAPRLDHSAKPEIFYEIIERMYPGLRKIELFARAQRSGWEAWGNDASLPWP